MKPRWGIIGATLGAAAALTTLIETSSGASRPSPAAGSVVADERPSERIVLANGLVVLLVVDHKAPLVGMDLRYRVGERDAPLSRPRLPDLVPRLMTQSTLHLGEGDYDRYLGLAGAFDAVWLVSLDRTIFRVTIPSDQLPLGLWMWSDQMGFLVDHLDDQLIGRRLAAMKSEWVHHGESVPAGSVGALIAAELYPAGHPYHVSSVRGLAGLQGLAAGELRSFVESHYNPAHAILSLTGDFDLPHARQLVEKFFGSLRNAPSSTSAEKRPAVGSVPAASSPPSAAIPPSLVGETRLKVAAHVELASVTMAWPTAPFYQPGDAELDLIAELLTGPRAGWLRWKLVDELKIASSVWAHQESRELGSDFKIHVTAAAGHSAAELTKAIDDVLRKLQSGPPDEHSFRGAVVGFLFDNLLALERDGVSAGIYGDCEDYNIGSGCLSFRLSRYVTIDAARLSAVASQALPLARRVVVEVTPAADASITGELRGRSVVPE